MANYNDAQTLLQQLKPIINQCIDNHPSVKSAIKAKKAMVAGIDNPVNTTDKTVTVRFPFDSTLINLPYNPQMETYLTTGTVKGKTVSVWFYQSLSNGIVMQDGQWDIAYSGDGGNIFDLIYPVGSIYMSVNNVNPQMLFGGTWEKIEGRFLLGASNNYSLGSVGGSEKHNHNGGSLGAQMQLGNNYIRYKNHDQNSWSPDWSCNPTMQETQGGVTSASTINVVGNTGDSLNMPPYLVVNIWKRTA